MTFTSMTSSSGTRALGRYVLRPSGPTRFTFGSRRVAGGCGNRPPPPEPLLATVLPPPVVGAAEGARRHHAGQKTKTAGAARGGVEGGVGLEEVTRGEKGAAGSSTPLHPERVREVPQRGRRGDGEPREGSDYSGDGEC
jgi:hypothetical protein